MKKTFYIFLDIDGVLYDWDYIINEMDSGRMKKGSFIDKFKPESIEALNFLIREQSKNYNVQLVISSTWRFFMEKTILILKRNGLQYNGPIHSTPISNDQSKRGEEILSYLKGKTNYDIVIIDDEKFDFKKHFDGSKIIKTEHYHSALSLNQIKSYIAKNNELSK